VIAFGTAWDATTRRPVEELDEDAAVDALAHGREVVVVEADAPGEVPDYVLVLREGGRLVTTQRYDGAGRLDLVVHHHDVGGALFRSGAVHYTYDSERPDAPVSSVRVLRYGPDGRVDERLSTRDRDDDVVEHHLGVEVAAHWLAPLEWGSWERLGLVEADELADPAAE
jgi:hypothetical protein